jgi:hypothetical protein
MFYKGVSINNTNEVARTLADDITNDIKLASVRSFTASQNDPSAPANTTKRFFCLGSFRYTYIIGASGATKGPQVKASDVSSSAQSMQAGVIRDDTGGNCQDSTKVAGSKPTQILGPDMQLNALDVAVNAAQSGVSIHEHIVFYGIDEKVFKSPTHTSDSDADHIAALNDPESYCSGGLLSTQFCAVSDINTNVTLGY